MYCAAYGSDMYWPSPSSSACAFVMILPSLPMNLGAVPKAHEKGRERLPQHVLLHVRLFLPQQRGTDGVSRSYVLQYKNCHLVDHALAV